MRTAFRTSLPIACLLAVFCTSTIANAKEPARIRVSPRDSRYFETTDGEPYIPIGLNMVSVYGKTPEDALAKMDGWMEKLAANRGNYARVWLSSPFWDVEDRKAGEYRDDKAERIDRLIAMAREHDIHLKLTLEHFREIDPEESRQDWALESLHFAPNGGTAESLPLWFSQESSREQFRGKLDWCADRYGDDPIVWGWELWNEINAVRGGDWRDWTEAMLPELHSRFPESFALQSLGSFDRDAAREQYQWLCELEDCPVAQVHRYLDLGAKLEVCRGPVDVLAADAVRELKAFAPNKPILLAETGAVEPNHAGPFELYKKDKAGIILHDALFAPFFAGAAGGGQIWHWDHYVDPGEHWRHFDRFAETVDGLDPPAEHFEPMMIEHPRLRIYVLRGRHTTLLWCRDKENTWKTELAEGRAPETLEDVTINLASPDAPLDDVAVRCYDPWSDQWTDGQVADGALTLPAFSRSIVVRYETP